MKKTKESEPQYINSPLNNPMLNYKVYTMSSGERLLVTLLAFLIGGAVGLIFYGGLFCQDGYPTFATHVANGVVFTLIGLLSIKFLTPIYRERQLNKQKNRIKVQFKDMLESLSASLSSGNNITNAFQAALNDLKMQYGESDFIVLEMEEIVNAMAQNVNIEVMLHDFGQRTGNEDIISFADVFEICYRKGGNMKSVIMKTRNVICDKMAVADEIETKLTSNKLQHNVMSLMPIAVVALLKYTNDAFSANFATPVGVVVNTIAIGIFLGAYKYGQKIVKIGE